MSKFRDVKTLQKLASAHASIHNHFNHERHLNRHDIFNHERHLNRHDIFKKDRTAALAEWSLLAA